MDNTKEAAHSGNECPPVLLEEFKEALIGYTMATPTTPVVAIYDIHKIISMVQVRDRVYASTARQWVMDNLIHKYWGTVGPVFRR